MVNLIQQPSIKGIEGDIDSLVTELSTAIVHKKIMPYSITT